MEFFAGNPKESLSCPHCGNNPVPHFLNWYNESLNILLTPLRQFLLYNPVSQALKKANTDWGGGLLRLAEGLGLVRRQPDKGKCKVKRVAVLWEEAEKRGIKFWELLLLGRPFDCYVAEKSGRQTVFSGLPRPNGYSNATLDVMDDKWLFKKMLMRKELPVPKGRSVTRFSEALAVFDSVQKPVITKPRTGSRGRHSTTFVNTREDLKKAFKIAKQLCHWVMVEEHLSGPIYRATLIDFKLCGVLRGDAPFVTGDGVKNIAQLVSAKNSAPHPGVSDIAIDEKTRVFLERQELKLESVPADGQNVFLSEKIGVGYGGSSSEDFEICHPDNKDLFVRAARALGDPILGFDYIIPDITKSYKEQRTGFIEVNSLPFINLHHDPLFGAPRNVAAAVWDMLGW